MRLQLIHITPLRKDRVEQKLAESTLLQPSRRESIVLLPEEWKEVGETGRRRVRGRTNGDGVPIEDAPLESRDDLVPPDNRLSILKREITLHTSRFRTFLVVFSVTRVS